MSEPTHDRPDLAVIDRAIGLVLSHHTAGSYCCWALRQAATGTFVGQETEYERQFSEWVRHSEGEWPWWWSTDAGKHKRARVNRLKSFRRACIAAGAKAAAIPAPGAAQEVRP
jgi:hypothetical protein